MKRTQRVFIALAAALGCHFTLVAQTAPVVVEAESGTSTNPAVPVAGATTGDWAFRTVAASGTTPAITYATSLTDVSAYTANGGVGGSAPATAARVLTYTVTFPAAGTYDLYARIRVGAGGANDDSFFYANSFGTKDPTTTTPATWVNANGLFNVGYTSGTIAVDGGGTGGTGVWKWVDMSKFVVNGSAATTFTVAAGALTQTFQIGAREDGLDFDKFVFGTSGLAFTVANLDAGQPGTVPVPPFIPSGPALATGKAKYLGCAYSTPQSPYFTKYWNSVTPENGGKWGSVEGTRGTFNWAELDSAYNRCAKIGGVFRMHNLVWGSQQPTWLKGLSDADQLTEINNWYKAVADHFAGKKIDFIDVVNEPIHSPPTGLYTVGSTDHPAGSADPAGGAYINALGGTTTLSDGTIQYNWIIKSFQLARQYFPNSKLVLNEYSVENDGNSAQIYVRMINQLKALNLIDGVGIQGHAFSTQYSTAATLRANLNTIAAPGVPLYITEYDSDALDANGNNSDAVQLAEYQRVFPIFWEHPAVKGVTLWGYRPGHWRTAQGAYLVNSDNTERAAMTWLRTYIQNTVLGTKAASAASAAIYLYPNPAQGGSVFLSLPPALNQQTIDVSLLNALGQRVAHQTLPPSAEAGRPLALPGVAHGIYTVRLQTSTGTFSQRLTVE
ncbi:endo-1,4-beta-xylanase [Hymenobacter ginkgonis]|uniref:endo-1,4-beta-xylanase n=1 Tax=Hymenobacter ginkgonis TaxID=2682976 RepID=UPI0018DC87A3|nr:endo-1,4-beta-xylanase [Hymenobacter ginkgonis]